MKKRRHWKACLFALLSASSVSAQAASVCAASNAQMMEVIKAVHDKQQNVGLGVALWAGDRLVLQEGLGWADRDRKIPFTANTRSMVASVGKAFTGLALLKAIEEGKIDPDAPIQAYIPEFPVKPELVLTARRLAAHLAGLRHWGPEREAILFKRHWNDVKEPMAYYMSDPLLPGAGTKYQYSSNDYNLLAVAIQNATGAKFENYVNAKVIKPIKLRSTGFDDVRSPKWRKVAPRYSVTEPFGQRRPLPAMTRVPDFDYSFNQGGGNMSSTAMDMVRLGRAVLKPGFLSPSSYQLLLTRPVINKVSSPSSFGWFLSPADGEQYLYITGAQPGAQAAVYVYPNRGLVIAAVANSWGHDAISTDLVMKSLRQMADLCIPPPEPVSK